MTLSQVSVIDSDSGVGIMHHWFLWQSPGGKRWLTHWASMLRWRWSISEYNLKTRDSTKRTLKSGPFVRERRGSGPAKQKPKHNPCGNTGNTKVHRIVWNPKGIPTISMENMKWYSPSQVLTVKHVSYPQLTATDTKYIDWEDQPGDPDPHYLIVWHNRQHHYMRWSSDFTICWVPVGQWMMLNAQRSVTPLMNSGY